MSESETISTEFKVTKPFIGGLLFTSMAIMAMQVAVSRLFSFMLWYHFAFLVISIAFLGFTSGGLLAHSRRRVWTGNPSLFLERTSMIGALSFLATFFILHRIPLEPTFLSSFTKFLSFLAVILVMLVPFFCCGLAICLALSVSPKKIHRLYAVNLAGSGLGCILIVILLDSLGVSASVVASGFLLWVAALFFGAHRRPRTPGMLWRGVVVVIWIGLTVLATNELHPLIYMKSNKSKNPNLRIPRELIMQRKSDSLSSVDFFNNPRHLGLWSPSTVYHGPLPEMIGVSIDSWAITAMFKREEVERKHSVLEYLPPALVYELGPVDSVLVIGCGGGVDVLTALHYGATSVTAIDINGLIIDAVKNDYAEWADNLYADPRVDARVAEGRHFLKRDTRKYDLVQLSGVDTFAATQSGAFALHENYLYTTEAIKDYLDALVPGGRVTFTRWLLHPPRHTLKLAAIIGQALKERGAERPQDHFVIVNSGVFTVIILQNEPMTREQVDQIVSEAGKKRYGILYAPYERGGTSAGLESDPFYDLWKDDPDDFIAAYDFDIRPSTDDRPFFHEHYRWRQLLSGDTYGSIGADNAQKVLLATLAITAFLCAIILILAKWGSHGIPRGLGFSGHFYFAALGLGYIFVENVLIQRMILYLGNPAYALSVILFSLLMFSGIGSGLAGRFPRLRRRAPLMMCGIVIILIGYSMGLIPILEAVLGESLAVRIGAVVMLIAPVATLMGMPFPWAMDRLGDVNERLVPWAWVINGAASVLGAVLTVMLAITYGFTTVFIIAAALYAGAALLWNVLPLRAS